MISSMIVKQENIGIEFYSDVRKIFNGVFRFFEQTHQVIDDTDENCDFKVYFHSDLNVYNNYLKKIRDKGKISILFHNSQGMILKEEGNVIVSTESNIILHYELNSKNILIYAINYESFDCEIVCIRIIRILIEDGLERNGWLMIHSAALTFNDEGYLLVGKKGSGKSSLSLRTCSLFNDSYLISSDRCFIRPSNEKNILFDVIPWSGINSIGLGLLYDLKKELVSFKSFLLNQNKLIIDKIIQNDYTPIYSCNKELKVDLTNEELNKYFNIKYKKRCKIKKVIFPRINSDRNFINDKKYYSISSHVLSGEYKSFPNFLELPIRNKKNLEKNLCLLDKVLFKTYNAIFDFSKSSLFRLWDEITKDHYYDFQENRYEIFT